jgi:hypothetical protein
MTEITSVFPVTIPGHHRPAAGSVPPATAYRTRARHRPALPPSAGPEHRPDAVPTRCPYRPTPQRQPARESHPRPPLRRQSPHHRLPLPRPGHAERTLSHARRQKHRAAHVGGPRQPGEGPHQPRPLRPKRTGRRIAGEGRPRQGPRAAGQAERRRLRPPALAAPGVLGAAAGGYRDRAPAAKPQCMVPRCARRAYHRARRPTARHRHPRGRPTTTRDRDATCAGGLPPHPRARSAAGRPSGHAPAPRQQRWRPGSSPLPTHGSRCARP